MGASLLVLARNFWKSICRNVIYSQRMFGSISLVNSYRIERIIVINLLPGTFFFLFYSPLTIFAFSANLRNCVATYGKRHFYSLSQKSSVLILTVIYLKCSYTQSNCNILYLLQKYDSMLNHLLYLNCVFFISSQGIATPITMRP